MLKQNQIFNKVLLLLFLVNGVINASNLTKEEVYEMNKVVGYFPGWGIFGGHEEFYVSKIPFDKLTHINMAFVEILNDYSLQAGEVGPDLTKDYGEAKDSPYLGNYGQLRKFRERYPHISLMMSVGGWTLSGKFSKLAKTDADRKKFAANCAAYVKKHQFDGLDIDWEFPGVSRRPDKVDCIRDQGNPAGSYDKENFTLLLKELRDALDKLGEEDNKYYQLTVAVGSGRKHIKQTNPKEYVKYLDFINVMTYDMHGAWEDRTNHHSPLYKNDDLPKDHLTTSEAINRFLKSGVDSRKLLIGVPAYSRGWSGVDCKKVGYKPFTDQNKTPGLGCYARDGSKGAWDGGRRAGNNPYKYFVEGRIGNPEIKTFAEYGFVKYRDEQTKTPYLYSEKIGEFYSYEDDVSLREKIKFVKEKNLAGVMLWELSEDAADIEKSLLKILHDELLTDITTTEKDPAKTDEERKARDTSAAKKKQLKREKKKEDRVRSDENATGRLFEDCVPGKVYSVIGTEAIIGGKLCKTKFWINNCTNIITNEHPYYAWSCSTYDVKSNTLISKKDKDIVKIEVGKIAKKLKNGDVRDATKEVDTNKTDKIADDAADRTIGAKKPKYKAPTPLTIEEIALKVKEQKMCHKNQAYHTNDICEYQESWYQFKWWHKFNNFVDSGVMVSLENYKDPIKTTLIPAKDIRVWNATKIYTMGKKVQYNYIVYKAKYWTQGNKPSYSSPEWELQGIADNTEKAIVNPGIVIDKNTTKEDLKKITIGEGNDSKIGDDGSIATYDPRTKKTIVTGGDENISKKIGGEHIRTLGDDEKFYMPFMDMTIWAPYNPDNAIEAGIKNFVFAFVTSADKVCSPKWGGYASYNVLNEETIHVVSKLKKIRDAGGVISVSFGGGGAGANELATVCKSKEKLADAYMEVIDKLKVQRIDFDIEGVNLSNTVSIATRIAALKIIRQKLNTEGSIKYPNLKISFTLPVMPFGLLENDGGVIVKAAMDAGVIDIVNLMLMDYGSAFPAERDGEYMMAGYSIQAIESVNKQLRKYDPQGKFSDVDNNYYHMIGATPMIGQNDTPNERFFKKDIEKLTQWCNIKGILMLSAWSINRDKVKTGWLLPKSSGLLEKDYGTGTLEFSKILKDRETEGDK